MRPEPVGAPWSIREQLRLELRSVTVANAKSPYLASFLVGAVEAFVRRTGQRALRRLVRGATGAPLATLMAQWVTEMPDARRAEWFVDRVSEAAGVVWNVPQEDAGEAIPLPIAERERIERALTRMWERLLSRHDDEPEAAEYVGVLMREVERIGRRDERVACRALTRRFIVRGGAALRLEEMLERDAPADAETAIGLLEKYLGLAWDGGA